VDRRRRAAGRKRFIKGLVCRIQKRAAADALSRAGLAFIHFESVESYVEKRLCLRSKTIRFELFPRHVIIQPREKIDLVVRIKQLVEDAQEIFVQKQPPGRGVVHKADRLEAGCPVCRAHAFKHRLHIGKVIHHMDMRVDHAHRPFHPHCLNHNTHQPIA